MSLQIGGQPLQGPEPTSSTQLEELFVVLCKKYRINEKIGRYLAAEEGLESLDEFLYFFTDQAEIGRQMGTESARRRHGLFLATLSRVPPLPAV